MAGNSHDHNARWQGTCRAHPIIPLGHFQAQFSRAPPEPRDIQIIYKSEWVGSGPGWDIRGRGVDAQIFRQSIHICITIGVSTVDVLPIIYVATASSTLHASRQRGEDVGGCG